MLFQAQRDSYAVSFSQVFVAKQSLSPRCLKMDEKNYHTRNSEVVTTRYQNNY